MAAQVSLEVETGVSELQPRPHGGGLCSRHTTQQVVGGQDNEGECVPGQRLSASTFTHFAISPTHPHFFVPWGLGTKEQKTWLSQHELYLLVL